MIDPSQPVLAYDRVDANRRNTWLLMAAFVLVLLPSALGISIYTLFAAALFLGKGQGVEYLLTAVPAASEFYTLLVASAVVLALMACVVYVVALSFACSSWFVVRYLGARSVSRDHEPDLCRMVENICIGAGLPQPGIYLLDSNTPNAFAIGADPAHAVLVVTRGLLRLLDRRELAGVIAHEISHIGNHDTRLNAILAAVVGTLKFPLDLTLLALEVDLRTSLGKEQGRILIVGGLVLVALWLIVPATTPWDHWWRILAIIAIPYALFVGPVLGMFLRSSVSVEREFLADADAALLTRDPAGLALALAKVAAADRSPVRAGAATAHLYFIDPLPPGTPWWDTIFPSHPAIIERIRLLAKMGDGVSAAALERAAETGSEYERLSLKDLGIPSAFDEHTEPNTAFFVISPRAILYQSPDGSSATLAELDKGALVIFLRMEKNFVQVRTTDGTVGYIVQSTRVKQLATGQGLDSPGTVHKKLPGHQPARIFTADTQPGTQFSLEDAVTPLYEKADGWSTVLAELPAGSVVTFDRLSENFVHVVAGRAAGYIPIAAAAVQAPAAPEMVSFQPGEPIKPARH